MSANDMRKIINICEASRNFDPADESGLANAEAMYLSRVFTNGEEVDSDDDTVYVDDVTIQCDNGNFTVMNPGNPDVLRTLGEVGYSGKPLRLLPDSYGDRPFAVGDHAPTMDEDQVEILADDLAKKLIANIKGQGIDEEVTSQIIDRMYELIKAGIYD